MSKLTNTISKTVSSSLQKDETEGTSPAFRIAIFLILGSLVFFGFRKALRGSYNADGSKEKRNSH